MFLKRELNKELIFNFNQFLLLFNNKIFAKIEQLSLQVISHSSLAGLWTVYWCHHFLFSKFDRFRLDYCPVHHRKYSVHQNH